MKFADVAENVRRLVESRACKTGCCTRQQRSGNPPAQDKFIVELLLAHGTPKATIVRLKAGQLNLAKTPGDILLKTKLWFRAVGLTPKYTEDFLATGSAKSRKTGDMLDTDFQGLKTHSEKTMAQLYGSDTAKRSEKKCREVTGQSPTSPRGVQMPASLREAHHQLAVDRL